jgi:hypothetical protein
MKRSLICLAMLATPLAACIVRPPEDCASCSDPSCPTSTSHSPPPSTYSSPPSPPPSSQSIPDALPPLWSERCGSDASPAVPPCNRDAGADLPSPSREVDAGAAVARPDSGVASPSDGGNLADLVAPSSCTDAGTCGKPVVPLCTWNHECGNGGRCADAECQRPCTSISVCGTGYTCQAGFCQPSGGAGGQCLYASDCTAGSLCINGFCHAGCKVDGDCPNRADACTADVCQPDGRPTPQCRSNRDCAADRECVNASCRTPCSSDENCGAACSGTLCREGYCVEAQEVAPQCSRNVACGAGRACVDAVCL